MFMRDSVFSGISARLSKNSRNKSQSVECVSCEKWVRSMLVGDRVECRGFDGGWGKISAGYEFWDLSSCRGLFQLGPWNPLQKLNSTPVTIERSHFRTSRNSNNTIAIIVFVQRHFPAEDNKIKKTTIFYADNFLKLLKPSNCLRELFSSLPTIRIRRKVNSIGKPTPEKCPTKSNLFLLFNSNWLIVAVQFETTHSNQCDFQFQSWWLASINQTDKYQPPCNKCHQNAPSNIAQFHICKCDQFNLPESMIHCVRRSHVIWPNSRQTTLSGWCGMVIDIAAWDRMRLNRNDLCFPLLFRDFSGELMRQVHDFPAELHLLVIWRITHRHRILRVHGKVPIDRLGSFWNGLRCCSQHLAGDGHIRWCNICRQLCWVHWSATWEHMPSQILFNVSAAVLPPGNGSGHRRFCLSAQHEFLPGRLVHRQNHPHLPWRSRFAELHRFRPTRIQMLRSE